MGTQSAYRVVRYETLVQFDSLQKEWAELIATLPDAPVFLTWEWMRTWWLHFAQDRELWLLIARDEQGRLVGIAPLMKEHRRVACFKLRTLAFIGTCFGTEVHNDLLVQPSDQNAVIKALLAFLFSCTSEWDILHFNSLSKESRLAGLFASAGVRYRLGIGKPFAYITLPGDWDTYLKTRSKKLQRNLRYFRSKLSKAFPGEVGFSYVTDPRELPSAIEDLEEFNKNRWHEKQRICNFDQAHYSSFHQDLARLTLERGWLRLYRLTVAGRAVAFCYSFHFKERVYAHMIGFDLNWSEYSPGRLAIAYSIKAAIEEGACEFDWGVGDHAYKLAWAEDVLIERDIFLSKNALGGLWMEWGRMKDLCVETARRWLPQSVRNRINQVITPRYRKTEIQYDKATD